MQILPVIILGLMKPFQVHLPIVNNVKMSFVHSQDIALTRVNAQRSCTINSSNCDTIARLDFIDEVVMGEDDHGVWSLSGGHVLWRFLKFDHLFIGEK